MPEKRTSTVLQPPHARAGEYVCEDCGYLKGDLEVRLFRGCQLAARRCPRCTGTLRRVDTCGNMKARIRKENLPWR